MSQFASEVTAQLPLGLPSTNVSLNLSHTMYEGKPGYREAQSGPYTHYVDNSDANCSDDGDGTAAQPRCRLPLRVNAGAVIEIHGGPYTDLDYDYKRRTLELEGTSAEPVFLRGVTDSQGNAVAYVDSWFDVTGQHFVVEGLTFEGTPLMVGDNRPVQRALIRDVTVTRNIQLNGVNLHGTDIVLTNSHIHHNYGDDRHGVFIGSNSERVWILGNDISYNGGDGVQFCHRCVTNPPRYVYIGGNNIYSNRENGVDLKYSRNVVVAQNRIHRHRYAPKNEQWCFDDNSYCGIFSSGSDGSSIVVGSDGGPIDVVIVFNEIFSSGNAIRVEEGEDILIANNLLFDFDISGLVLERQGGSVNFVNNTLYEMESGVRQKRNSSYELSIANNLFTSIENPLLVLETNAAQAISLDSNLFWNNNQPISLRWGDSRTVSTSADFNALEGKVKTGNIVADPALGAQGDPSLPRNSSAAIDSANDDLVGLDAGFRSRYPSAPSILVGYRGYRRDGCDIDIGAIEVNCDAGLVSGSPPDPGDGSGGGGTGGGGDPGDPGEPGEGDGAGAPIEISAGDSLPGRAERHYDPDYAVDFTVSLSQSVEMAVPGMLPVVEGKPGKNWASLSLGDSGDADVCFYRGDGKGRKTDPPCNRENGSVYVFEYCVPESVYVSAQCGANPEQSTCKKASNTLAPHETRPVNRLSLSLIGGDSCGVTVVETEFTTTTTAPVPDPPEAPDPPEDPPDPSGGPLVEGTLIARAERRYNPEVPVDFEASLGETIGIVIPAFLPVIQGKPGKNWAILTLRGNEQPQYCVYRGDGNARKTNAPCGRENGSAYVFEYCVSQAVYTAENCAQNLEKSACRRAASPLEPSSGFLADQLTLSLLGGDSCGVTVSETAFATLGGTPTPEPPDEPEDPNAPQPPQDPPGSSDGAGATLTARAERRYNPEAPVDFEASMTQPRSIIVPPALPVVEGKPGKNWALLRLRGESSEQYCVYRGDGKGRKTNAPCSRENGSAYVFEYCVSEEVYAAQGCSRNLEQSACRKAASLLTPSDSFLTEHLTLSLLSGDSCGTTVVEADL